MKLWAAVVLGIAVGSFQLRVPTPHVGRDIHKSEHIENYTLPAVPFDTIKDIAAAAGDGTASPITPQSDPENLCMISVALVPGASDEVWEKARCKGANFMRSMRGSDREAGSLFRPPRDSAAAGFEEYDDIQKWGWEYASDEHVSDFKYWGIDGALRDLGIDTKCSDQGGSFECMTFHHGREDDSDYYDDSDDSDEDDHKNRIPIDQDTYNVDGRIYRKTGGHYCLGFEGQKGVIIAMDRRSPKSAGKKRSPVIEGDDLPALRASSDIAWLVWKKLSKDVQNLNYFLSLSICNEETQTIVSRAIQEYMPEAEAFVPWTGHEISTDTPQGQAILGTPNAQAFCYMLLQHKATLGNLYISRVRIFLDTREPNPGLTLLLFVEPVPANTDVGKPGNQQEARQIRRDGRDTSHLKLRANL
ncbi:hypothetical protein EKO04_006280 [Ascochyta lentis]|uniref:Uncharacterized protein n=1 Tax=Ascochyta lentis TaxID=205686 RepID=A0A8H7J3T0_9PLEO|nr:hypothetical protein EKO04_006280 [Ascochyta lentis]